MPDTKRTAAPLPTRHRKPTLDIRPGRVWKSFEQFRTGGQNELSALGAGEMGQLLTKTGSFRILHEEDFQRLYGLARDVERVQGGLRVIIAAARSARRHQDDDTLQTLLEAVAVCADFPVLATRPAEESIEPEGLPLTDDDLDGIILDPALVPRPFASRNANK